MHSKEMEGKKVKEKTELVFFWVWVCVWWARTIGPLISAADVDAAFWNPLCLNAAQMIWSQLLSVHEFDQISTGWWIRLYHQRAFTHTFIDFFIEPLIFLIFNIDWFFLNIWSA